MKNFEVTHEGKTYWVSRSLATVTYHFAFINDQAYILANKRGSGMPTNVGKWNCPSGYLDFGETLEECAVREIYEETGVTVPLNSLTLMEIDSAPTRRGMQNVLVRYRSACKYDCLEDAYAEVTTEHSEPNEVEEVKWIPMSEIKNYEWVSEKHVKQIIEAYEIYTNLRSV